MKQLLSVFFFILLSVHVFSQVTTLSKEIAYVGEKVDLFYEVKFPSEIKDVKFQPNQQFIQIAVNGKKIKNQNLEIVASVDTIISEKNSWRFHYSFYVWDEGEFVIAANKVRINGQEFELPAKVINVIFPAEINNGDILETDLTMIDYSDETLNFGWIILGIVLTLILLTLIFIRLRKLKANKQLPELSRDNLAQGIFQLEELKQRKIGSAQALNELYVDLSWILQHFIEQEYKVSIKEKTTREIQLILNQLQLKSTLIQECVNLLERADMVKFAQALPALQAREMDIEQAIVLLQKLTKDV